MCNISIKIRNACLHINKEKYKICLLGCYCYLTTYGILKDVFTINHPSSGINNGEFSARPFTLAILPITCSTSNIAHNGMASLCQTIEKCRFTHIGATYDSY